MSEYCPKCGEKTSEDDSRLCANCQAQSHSLHRPGSGFRLETINDPIPAIVRAGYEPGNGTTEGEQMWNGQWWRPRWGCDTLEKMMEEAEFHLTKPASQPILPPS